MSTCTKLYGILRAFVHEGNMKLAIELNENYSNLNYISFAYLENTNLKAVNRCFCHSSVTLLTPIQLFQDMASL